MRRSRLQHLVGALRRGVAIAALLLPTFAGGQAVRAGNLDWCAPIAVHPDQRFVDTATCQSVYSDSEIAANAEAVMIGDFTDVAHPVVAAPPRTCDPTPSHTANSNYVGRLRAARAAVGGTPLEIVHLSRMDLVPTTFAALPGFAASYLTSTTRPWADVLGFFANDRSGPCATGLCRWSDSWGGDAVKDPPGGRLRDYIDRSGGTGRSETTVYYMARPGAPPLVYWPTAAIADLRNPAYRAWRVAEAKEAIRLGGYSAIELSHKLFQYREHAHWIGSPFAPNVDVLNASGDTLWTAPPTGYDYAEYVTGWSQLAADMRAANVPYTITITWRAWAADGMDDPATTSVNEAELIRAAMRGAKTLFLDRPVDVNPTDWNILVSQIQAAGPRIIPFDQACGYGPSSGLPGVPGRPTVLP